MKTNLILIAFLYSLNSFACLHHGRDQVDCVQESFDQSNMQLTVSEDNFCSDDRYLEEAKLQYDNFPKSKKIKTKKIKGKKIKGLKEELEFLDLIIGGGWRDQKIAKEALDKCDEVFCILENSFGSKESAYRALNIAYRSSYAVSLKSQSNVDYIWSKQELRNLNYSVNLMPDHMLNSKTMGKFYVLPNNAYPGNKRYVGGLAGPGLNKTGDILYTDHIRKHNDEEASHIMIHEMIHQYDADNVFSSGKYRSDSDGYCKQNGWKKDIKVETKNGYSYETDVWSAQPDKACYVTDYASKRPREDFAEAVTYYMLDPERLKNKCPKNYEYLKKHHFKGKEYTKPDFDQKLEQYIVDNSSTLKKCISSDLSSISIGKSVRFVKPVEGASNMSQLLQNVTPQVSEDCLTHLTQISSSLIPDVPFTCTNKLVPNNIKSKVKTLMNKHFNQRMNDDIKKIFANESLSKFSKECFEIKDLRNSCVKAKANKAISDLGYAMDGFDSISIDRDANYEIFLPKQMDTYALLSEAVYDYHTNLKTIIEKPNFTSAFTREGVKENLEKQGYLVDSKDMTKIENKVYDEHSSKVMETLTQTVLTKSFKDYKQECPIMNQSKCIKGKIKEVFIKGNPEEPTDSLDRFVKLVFSYMKNNQD